MASDLSEYVKRFEPPVKGETYNGVSTYVTDPNALDRLAVDLVQKLFPNYISAGSAKFSAKEPEGSENGTYTWGPFSGAEEIRIAKLRGRYGNGATTFTPTEKGIKQGRKPEGIVDFNIQEVAGQVNLLLHELYHDRSKAGGRGDRKATMELFGVTPDHLQRANKIAMPEDSYDPGTLFSMKKSGLDVEEFLANAVSLLDMKDKGLIPEQSRVAAQLSTVEKIMAEIPQMGKFINAQRQPEMPTMKPAKRELGIVDSLLQVLTGK